MSLSKHQGLSNEALRIMLPKYWSFSFSISPSSEYSGLISFRIDWFALPAVQRTLKSLLQHHSSCLVSGWNPGGLRGRSGRNLWLEAACW